MKKMKKMLMFVLCLMMTAGACACSVNEGLPEGAAAIGAPENSIVKMDGEVMYAKVNNVTGNEMELALLQMPELETEGEMDDDAFNDSAGSDSFVPAAPLIIGEAGENGMEIEPTGETVNVTVPAGVKIVSGQKNATLDEIKSGSIICIVVDNKDDMNLKEIEILES